MVYFACYIVYIMHYWMCGFVMWLCRRGYLPYTTAFFGANLLSWEPLLKSSTRTLMWLTRSAMGACGTLKPLFDICKVHCLHLCVFNLCTWVAIKIGSRWLTVEPTLRKMAFEMKLGSIFVAAQLNVIPYFTCLCTLSDPRMATLHWCLLQQLAKLTVYGS